MEEQMSKKLPARPNLEHLRSQAKALLAQLAEGTNEAATTFVEYLPAALNMTPDQVRRSGFRLADAQSVIARKSGFSNWPALGRHVEKLRQLEGTWEFLDLELDGRAVPANMVSRSRMLIDGDRFRMESPEANYEGVFTIDVERVPYEIDIEFVEGPEAGNWSYGIFELEGDRFKLCLGLTGVSRPRSFTTFQGSGHALENLRRILKARPEDVHGGEPQPRRQAVQTHVSKFEVEMTPLLKQLQGEWIPLELVQNGQAMPAAMLSFGSRSAVGNEVKVVFGGQVMVHVKLRIDDSQSPIAVDYLNVGRSLTGTVSLGIMEWIGDEVRFCMAAPGEPRPADFSSEPGSSRTLSRWRRK
jgi:uncharacterized protein (TIGR03067 family)